MFKSRLFKNRYKAEKARRANKMTITDLYVTNLEWNAGTTLKVLQGVHTIYKGNYHNMPPCLRERRVLAFKSKLNYIVIDDE